MSIAHERAGDADGLASFIGKWQTRWPEWVIAEVFVPAGRRQVALAWAALQQELLDAAWGGTDARPGEAKLGWWQEELHGWSQGRRRHPLGVILQREPAPWLPLAAALPSLRESRERPQDADEAFALLEPAAAAAVAIDGVLFDPSGTGGDPRVVAATWLATRLVQQGEAAVPLERLAAAGGDDPVRLWAEALSRRWPQPGPAPRPRRLWAALARARLSVPGRPLPPWRTLWLAWRAVRN